MRGLAVLACSLFPFSACGRAQDAPPVGDSAHHRLLATIPLESPRLQGSLVLAAEPASQVGRGHRLLVGMPGPAARVLVVDVLARAVERILEPPRKEVSFGTAVEWVGDLDSDGEPDIAVGAPRDQSPSEQKGCVLLYSSKSGMLLRELDGIDRGDWFGGSLSARGTTLVVGCTFLQGKEFIEGGYACYDLRTTDPPVVRYCGNLEPLGWKVWLADGDEGPGSLVLTSWCVDITCRRLADGVPLWGRPTPNIGFHIAAGNNPGEVVVASWGGDGEGPSVLQQLNLGNGHCRLHAEPGGVAAVADGRALVVLDEQAGLQAFEDTSRLRTWIEQPIYRCNPDSSALCFLPSQRVIAWAAAYTDQAGNAAGELRLYEVLP